MKTAIQHKHNMHSNITIYKHPTASVPFPLTELHLQLLLSVDIFCRYPEGCLIAPNLSGMVQKIKHQEHKSIIEIDLKLDYATRTKKIPFFPFFFFLSFYFFIHKTLLYRHIQAVQWHEVLEVLPFPSCKLLFY